MIIYFISLLLIITLILFQFKYSFIKFKFNTNNHDIVKKKIDRIGGLYLLIFLLINIFNFKSFGMFGNTIIFLFFSIIIFLIGFIDDLFQINNKLKLFLLLFTTVMYVYLSDNYINNFNVGLIDSLNKIFIFNLLITSFCILVIVISYNVIDGLNGLLLFEFCKLLLILSFFSKSYELILFLIFVSILCFFNFQKSYFYMGDGGSYLLGFISSVMVLNFQNISYNFDPWLFACLFAYPFCEQFISMIRRYFFLNISPFKPDNLHLHHLVYSKFMSKLNNPKNANKLASLLISLINLLFIFIIIINFSYNYVSFKYLFFYYLVFYVFNYFLIYKIEKKVNKNHGI